MKVSAMARQLLSERKKTVDAETLVKIIQRAEANVGASEADSNFTSWLCVEEAIFHHTAPPPNERQFMGRYSAK